jgi:hypothetical protein
VGERRRDPLERLRALDQALARRASVEARESARRRIQRRVVEQPFHVRLRWWPALAFAAGAITMGLLLISDGLEEPARRSGSVEVAEVGAGPEVGESVEVEPTPGPTVAPAEPSCAELRPGLVHLEADECAYGDGVRVSALLPSHLQWDAGSIELGAGELLFDVAPRSDRPLHVTFGEIDIEVVGTRFVVHHEGTQGWISMLEGHVRTRVGGGPAGDLRGGERLEWPGPAADRGPATAPASKRARPAKAAALDEGLAELLAEVADLRRRGAYREAVERLRAGDSRSWSRRARQLVSYEIGTLLERQLEDATQACAHWAEHRRRYPNGRHDAIVVRAMERLGCGEAGA